MFCKQFFVYTVHIDRSVCFLMLSINILYFLDFMLFDYWIQSFYIYLFINNKIYKQWQS